MRRLLHAVFNEPLPQATFDEVRAFGFDGVRIDAQRTEGEVAVRALVDPALEAGLWPLVLVTDGRWLDWLPPGVAVELRNEPDLEGPSPESYRQLLLGMRELCEARGVELWAPAISNLLDRGFAYLEAIADALPPQVSIHWYPHRPWLPLAGHEGRTREAEVDRLRAIIGDRTFGVSEMGYHTAHVCTGWWLWRRCRALTDAEATANLRSEFAFWAAQGAAFCTLYQIHDGWGDGPLDRYGIRAVDGDWKPQADVLT